METEVKRSQFSLDLMACPICGAVVRIEFGTFGLDERERHQEWHKSQQARHLLGGL